MKVSNLILAAAVFVIGASSVVTTSALAEEKPQFFPSMTYRTGAYAPSGVPFGNGPADYIKLVNARGGVNGVKILVEECETGYSTERGIECYERLKNKHGGASAFLPGSTNLVEALTEKLAADKISVVSPFYGRNESADGTVFKFLFPLTGSEWGQSDILAQAIAQKVGGFDKLKGKKIALVYHDSPYGRKAIPALEVRAAKHGFELSLMPVADPGVDQKSTWLQIRQIRPDYVILWSWGIMTSTAIKEAQATGYPREQMIGNWWSGSEADVQDIGAGAKGYTSLVPHDGNNKNATVLKDILSEVYAKGQGSGSKDKVNEALYMTGLLHAFYAVEGVRVAQERFGKGKWMNSEQVRWGLENLNLTQAKLDALGFKGVIKPMSTSCQDHQGATWARVHTWDGSKFGGQSDWYQADKAMLQSLTTAAADKYAAEQKITRRTPADCKS